ncbi:MAG: ABC transporter permease [Bacteroidota bacterium]|nr:ABC transporter permease [Bacteroidota bacterium]
MQKTVIDPDHSSSTYWKDLWAYRGLFRFLAWRDLLVRYKQTVIGVAWAVIRPLLTILVFSFLASLINPKLGVGAATLIVTAASLPWTLFSAALTESSNSLISNSNLITKIYFPRLIVPLSTVIVCLVDFAISLVILIGLMIYFHSTPEYQTLFQPLDYKVLFLPLFLLLTLLASMGAGIFLASLNVKYRDFRYIVPVVVQLGLYISPVAWTSDVVWETNKVAYWLKILYCCNPMVGVIDGFRWCLLGIPIPHDGLSIKISCAVTLVLLITGVRYFRRVEKNFADII